MKRDKDGNVVLVLDESQAWFLTQILENSLEHRKLFYTIDENDKKTFDQDFYEEISSTLDRLLEIRLK